MTKVARHNNPVPEMLSAACLGARVPYRPCGFLASETPELSAFLLTAVELSA